MTKKSTARRLWIRVVPLQLFLLRGLIPVIGAEIAMVIISTTGQVK